MTIAALRLLLDEIDTQGGPEAARQGRLHLPDQEGTHPMTTAPALSPADAMVKAGADARLKAITDTTPSLPVGQLLKWGDEHPDPEVQDQAARARVALHGLRRRYAADQELAAIASEREQLEQRLAEIRAREAELAPAKKAKSKRKAVGYPAAEVRAWAKEQGVDCPAVGRVPKAVVEAWRKATGSAA
jgi:hypothetical protein